MKTFFLLFLITAQSAFAGQVIDLGKMEVRGKVRGPEVQIIDPNELKEKSAQRFTQLQLEELERELLKHTPPMAHQEGK